MTSDSDQQPEPSSADQVEVTCLSCGHTATVSAEALPSTCSECGGTLDLDEETIRKPGQRPRDTMLGETIGGRYQLVKRIGTGGFGRVYEAIGVAEDSQTELQYAVKILHDRYCDEPRSVDEFFNEVKKASLLAHPAVVTVIDSGWHGGTPYIAMEYIRGVALKDVLKERGGRLDVATSLRIVAQVADVVASAHDTGLIHRDIKPANIMVIGECEPTMAQVKVLDFGIAKLETEMSQDRLTIAGTAGYQAPEQAEGHPTQASDVWALGVVLYQLLNGRLPNKSPEGWPSERKREYLAKGEPFPFEELEAPGDIQAEIEHVVKRLLSYEADDRPSARETYIRLDTLRVKAMMVTSREKPETSRPAPVVEIPPSTEAAPQREPTKPVAEPPPEEPPAAAERAGHEQKEAERAEVERDTAERAEAERPAAEPAPAEPKAVGDESRTATASTQTDHWSGVQEAARRRAAHRTPRSRRRPRRTFGRTVGRLIAAIVVIAILCAIATGLGLVYFREDAVLQRMARATNAEKRLKEDRRYQSWVKYHDLVLSRFGAEADTVRVRAGLLFYEGRADEAYEVAGRHRREDLRPWLFDLVKSRVQGDEPIKTKMDLIVSVQGELSNEQRAELSRLLDEASDTGRTSRGGATGSRSGQRLPSRLPGDTSR